MVCLHFRPVYLVEGVELADGFSLASSNELEVSMEDSGSGGVTPFSASQVVMYLREGTDYYCLARSNWFFSYLWALLVL